MALVFNGVTIPENVANALMVNGVSVTQVIANGVTVWKQSLFNARWSGDSIVSGGAVVGFVTSGNLFRSYYNGGYGPWNTANSNGTFTSGGDTGFYSVKCSGSQIWTISGLFKDTPAITYTLGSGFSGGVTYSSSFSWFLESGGGLMRQRSNNATVQGAWISLT